MRLSMRNVLRGACALGLMWGSAGVLSARTAISPDVVISQVYGAGGNTGATYQRDFIELFNRGSAPVSLAGWSVQYASASGTSLFAANLTVLPNITLLPGQYFLVMENGGANGLPLPSPDVTDTLSLAAGSGKVALVNSSAGLACNGGSTLCDPAQLGQIVDMVGYGSADFYEGSGSAAAASATNAVVRAGGGCADTDDNAHDFSALAPTPRTTASPLNVCGVATSTPTPSPTATPTRAPVPMDVCAVGHVVISEFRTRGLNGGNDEFVELFNVLPSAVNVGGWQVWGSGGTGAVSARVTISAGVVLPAYGYYLLTNHNGYTGTVAGDQSYGTGLADNGGVALLDASGGVVDEVGMGAGSAYGEGTRLTAMSASAEQSYARLQAGARDTNDNASDFAFYAASSDPQNSASPAAIYNCPTPTATATSTMTATPTRTPTATPTRAPVPMDVCAVGHVVISEFRTRGLNGGNDEFVELFNVSPSAVSVGGWQVWGSGGTGAVSARVTISAGVALPAYGYYLLTNHNGYTGTVAGDQSYGTGLADNGGVALLDASGAVVDEVGMGAGSAYGEGTRLTAMSASAEQSYARLQAGARDTNDNASDFAFYAVSSDPQNSASPAAIYNCPTPTATATATPTATPTPTVVATNVYINEVDADQTGTDTAEFIELSSGADFFTRLDGLFVVLFNGSSDASYRTVSLNGFSTGAEGLFVMGSAGVNGVSITLGAGVIQNGADAVALFAGDSGAIPNGTTVTNALASGARLIDALVYDTGQSDDAVLLRLLNAGQPQVNEDTGGKSEFNSNQRCADGSPPYRNTVTYAQLRPTPNRRNPCGNTAIALAGFEAQVVSAAKCANASGAECVVLRWQTLAEVDTLGFVVWRAEWQAGQDEGRGMAVPISPILESRSPGGAVYGFLDEGCIGGTTYTYWLQEIALDGTTREYGPLLVVVDGAVADAP